MTAPSFDAVLGGLGNKAIDALRMTLRDSYDSFTPEERGACERLMFSLAKAHLYELAGFDVSDQLHTLEVAFQQWAVVGKQVIVDGVKKAATEVFGLAGAFAAGALGTLVKGVA